MLKGSEGHFAHSRKIRIIDAHHREILGHVQPALQGKLDQLVGNLVVVAHDSRGVSEAPEQVVSHFFQVDGHRRIQPQYFFLVGTEAGAYHGVQKAFVPERSLSVIALKDAGDLRMSGIDQHLCRFLGDFAVVDAHTGDIDIAIKRIKEDDRDVAPSYLFIIMKIRIGKSAFCRFHDETVDIVLLQNSFENSLLAVKPVVGKRHLHDVLVF